MGIRNLFIGMFLVSFALFLSFSGCSKSSENEILIGEYESLTGAEAIYIAEPVRTIRSITAGITLLQFFEHIPRQRHFVVLV